ncbi:hypothetical protein MRX96_034620 [Rhipicephalus microplus]
MSEDKEVKPVHGMFAVPAPPAFDFDRTSEWPSWIQLFDDYRFTSGLNERSEEAQVRTLLYTMGRQAREIFSTFTLSEQQQKQYETRFGKSSLEGDRPTTAATAARNQRRTFGSASQQPGRGQQTTAAPKEFFRTAFQHLVKDQCTGHTRSTHQTTVLPTSHIQFVPQLQSMRAPEDLLPGTSCEMQLLRLFRTFCSGVSEKVCRRAKEGQGTFNWGQTRSPSHSPTSSNRKKPTLSWADKTRGGRESHRGDEASRGSPHAIELDQMRRANKQPRKENTQLKQEMSRLAAEMAEIRRLASSLPSAQPASAPVAMVTSEAPRRSSGTKRRAVENTQEEAVDVYCRNSRVPSSTCRLP